MIVGEIDPPTPGAGRKDAIRQRILSAREALLRHRWASQVIESRTGGAGRPVPPTGRAVPHIIEIATALAHDGESAVGQGCDDQFEFEFALDVLLDGFERLHQRGWTSTASKRAAEAAG
ncbi:hypothetical protein [Amycolatopsis sp. H20-H5]|uniref:hypothetical protein n=1 Tax=Amycolatopsis sp. H20-H5 TaxID=3046309 RepID=UPI002DC04F29|nr:hypothetical protein [Amycolatopsis sp. H20-H5]MEC3980581.1 hypothetical protein [Amycolatopsis sp. H20-H5]